MTQLQVNQSSHGLLNPGLGWLLSCLDSFIGLRCLTRARAYTGRTRAIWLLIASVAVGGTGIWAMHFFAQQDVFGDVFAQAEAPADVPRE